MGVNKKPAISSATPSSTSMAGTAAGLSMSWCLNCPSVWRGIKSFSLGPDFPGIAETRCLSWALHWVTCGAGQCQSSDAGAALARFPSGEPGGDKGSPKMGRKAVWRGGGALELCAMQSLYQIFSPVSFHAGFFLFHPQSVECPQQPENTK